MLEELNVRELLPVFLMRVLDFGNLLLTDALREPVGLQAFKAPFDAGRFGEAKSSTLLKMTRGSVGAGEVEQSRALGCGGLGCCYISFEMHLVCCMCCCIVLSGRLHFRNLNVNEK